MSAADKPLSESFDRIAGAVPASDASPFETVHSQKLKGTVPHLSQHFRVVTTDGRGNGRSDRPTGRPARTPTASTTSMPTSWPCSTQWAPIGSPPSASRPRR